MAEVQKVEFSVVLRMVDGVHILWGEEEQSLERPDPTQSCDPKLMC